MLYPLAACTGCKSSRSTALRISIKSSPSIPDPRITAQGETLFLRTHSGCTNYVPGHAAVPPVPCPRSNPPPSHPHASLRPQSAAETRSQPDPGCGCTQRPSSCDASCPSDAGTDANRRQGPCPRRSSLKSIAPTRKNLSPTPGASRRPGPDSSPGAATTRSLTPRNPAAPYTAVAKLRCDASTPIPTPRPARSCGPLRCCASTHAKSLKPNASTVLLSYEKTTPAAIVRISGGARLLPGDDAVPRSMDNPYL